MPRVAPPSSRRTLGSGDLSSHAQGLCRQDSTNSGWERTPFGTQVLDRPYHCSSGFCFTARSCARPRSRRRFPWWRLPRRLWFSGGRLWLPGRRLWVPGSRLGLARCRLGVARRQGSWLGLGLGLAGRGRLVGLARLGLGSWLGLGFRLGLGPRMGLGLALGLLSFPAPQYPNHCSQVPSKHNG